MDNLYLPDKIVRGNLVSAVVLGAVDDALHQSLRVTDTTQDTILTDLLSASRMMIEGNLGYLGNFEWTLTYPAGNGRFFLPIPTVKDSTLPEGWTKGTGMFAFMDGEFSEEFEIQVENEFTPNDVNVLKVVQRSLVGTMYRSPDYGAAQDIRINPINASLLAQFRVKA